MKLKILSCVILGYPAGSISITGVLIRGRHRVREGDGMMKAESWAMHFEDGESWKIEEKDSLPGVCKKPALLTLKHLPAPKAVQAAFWDATTDSQEVH